LGGARGACWAALGLPCFVLRVSLKNFFFLFFFSPPGPCGAAGGLALAAAELLFLATFGFTFDMMTAMLEFCVEVVHRHASWEV